MTHKISVAVAGSTERTLVCAQALAADSRFQISWVLTPVPKPVGRQQLVTANPLHVWARQRRLPVVLLKSKIDTQLQTQIQNQPQPDYLLVVDFGYLIPQWLLAWPRVYPVNVHPSALPRWRGSAPGQFVLLAGEKKSAVSLMVLNQQLDQGPIIHQPSFTVQPTWTQQEYYQHSFELATQFLADQLAALAQPQPVSKTGQPSSLLTPQPLTSPTPTARRLQKADAFVPWEIITQAMQSTPIDQAKPVSLPLDIPDTIDQQPVLTALLNHYPPHYHPIILEQASRALAPWPFLWTNLPTSQGKKRMKITAAGLTNHHQLILKKVIIAGLAENNWSAVKNQLHQS